MRRLLEWLAPRRVERGVRAGCVTCPLRRRDVDVRQCLTCSFTNEVIRDEDGEVLAVRCTPVFGSRTAPYR